ncbi:cytochrome P450 [Polyporus arcularius HHB13444]|uniref:Cytochrome P450 n=1 Tax=Polyporus arcularius HHB13444 TaxID=1314778 RepID=A0A5C3P7A7_9APHY|nr:cytochrome P450 [Polyporus arcularius HHB13444]
MLPFDRFLGSATSGHAVEVLIFLSILLGVYSAYQVFFSKLSIVPGPWYAAVSDLWLLSWSARLQQNSAIHALFQRYGPVVRIGPRRVVFCDRDAMKTVYSVHRLDKSNFYKALLADGHDHAITSITEAEHNRRRRHFASHYALSHIARFQPEINLCVLQLVEGLRDAPRGSTDSIDLLRHLLADIVRITVFGTKPQSVNNWKSGAPDPICQAIQDFPTWAILHSITPTLLFGALAHIPSAKWRRLYYSHDTLISFVKTSLEDNKAHYPQKSDMESATPLMLRLMKQSQYNSVSDQDIISECMAHLVGGTETSATTFGYMLWELSRREDIVHKLREELDEVISDRRTIPDHRELTMQPYLNAFINEGFRLYGGVSAVLERVVPPRQELRAHGAPVDSFHIMGYPMPPGTIVGTQAWSMHRDLDFFPNPDVFAPERWLHRDGDDNKDDAERLNKMSQYFIPFGVGTRACPGRYQAYMVFRITIAALVLSFDFIADPKETNERTMATRDAFATHPAAGECKLTFILNISISSHFPPDPPDPPDSAGCPVISEIAGDRRAPARPL